MIVICSVLFNAQKEPFVCIFANRYKRPLVFCYFISQLWNPKNLWSFVSWFFCLPSFLGKPLEEFEVQWDNLKVENLLKLKNNCCIICLTAPLARNLTHNPEITWADFHPLDSGENSLNNNIIVHYLDSMYIRDHLNSELQKVWCSDVFAIQRFFI